MRPIPIFLRFVGPLAWLIARVFSHCVLLVPALLLTVAAHAAYDVKAFGAKGDGRTLDTAAINAAIAAASAAGGGTVTFPAGTYLSFSVHLASHIELKLEAGAVLVAAEPPVDLSSGYDAPEANAAQYYQDFGHTHWHNSLIWGEDLVDVAITGPGRIYGRGLSRGLNRGAALRDLLPEEVRAGQKLPPQYAPKSPLPAPLSGPFGYPRSDDELPPGVGNKSIALKNCRHVILRDLTFYQGGHFALLLTGIDHLLVDNITIDTNRDGMDIDDCTHVLVANCTVNSPRDDGICFKSSYGLGSLHACDDVAVVNCQVSGYDEGTLLDGTFQRTGKFASSHGPIGRIKFGTESNGSFRNVAISNCVFEYCGGLAIESVDGAAIEDVTVSNVTMRDIVNAPVFLRIGSRLRGPNSPVVGTLRRVRISNLVAHHVAVGQGILLAGIPGHNLEDISLSDIFVDYVGGGTAQQAVRQIPEQERNYPEPTQFGTLPSFGLYARHVAGLTLHHIELRANAPEGRPAIILDDVAEGSADHLKLPRAATAQVIMKGTTHFLLEEGRSRDSAPASSPAE